MKTETNVNVLFGCSMCFLTGPQIVEQTTFHMNISATSPGKPQAAILMGDWNQRGVCVWGGFVVFFFKVLHTLTGSSTRV